MCGIVGYVGHRNSTSLIVQGLKRLEYRGYDSAGIAVQNGKGVEICRVKGKIALLEKMLEQKPLAGTVSLGHTRWATHGAPSENNAHPHKFGSVIVVHNGIIENYQELRSRLAKKGHRFSSETDTEIVAHLIQRELKRTGEIESAVRAALSQVRGSYALGVMIEGENRIVAAKKDSPLIIGKGKGENFIASDIPALLPYTQDMIFMDDNEMAVLTPSSIKIQKLDSGKAVTRQAKRITWSASVAEKEGYRHFMLKEIFEQPGALIDTFRGRLCPDEGEVNLNGANLKIGFVKRLEKVVIVACGTAWHSGLIGKFFIEKLARIPVEVDLASEFRYRDPILNRNSLIIAISQSGETADTLAALEEGKRAGALSLAVTNTVESSVARRSDQVLYTHAGPEIGVASTKCFLVQMVAMLMIALYLGKARGKLKRDDVRAHIEAILKIPSAIQSILKQNDAIAELAKRHVHRKDFFYLGRGINYPIALEGALKLKEIAYINTQGYPAGEMKHGPIALIDEEWPVIAVVPKTEHYEKMISNVEEVRSRGGIVIAIATAGDKEIRKISDEVIFIPKTEEILSPFLTAVVLQLFAYHAAVLRGTDVDQPRNLAKSVTVE